MDMFDNMALGKILSSEKENTSGSCPMPEGKFPVETPAAMAYVPFQQWEKPYEQDVALQRGTIFQSLDKPFIGEEAVKNADVK